MLAYLILYPLIPFLLLCVHVVYALIEVFADYRLDALAGFRVLLTVYFEVLFFQFSHQVLDTFRLLGARFAIPQEEGFTVIESF